MKQKKENIVNKRKNAVKRETIAREIVQGLVTIIMIRIIVKSQIVSRK